MGAAVDRPYALGFSREVSWVVGSDVVWRMKTTEIDMGQDGIRANMQFCTTRREGGGIGTAKLAYGGTRDGTICGSHS